MDSVARKFYANMEKHKLPNAEEADKPHPLAGGKKAIRRGGFANNWR
jgi:hypothetical protein